MEPLQDRSVGLYHCVRYCEQPIHHSLSSQRMSEHHNTELRCSASNMSVGLGSLFFRSELASAFQEKVSSRSFDGRRLRRHVLRGAVIVFVTAGYSGKKFIFKKVRVCISRHFSRKFQRDLTSISCCKPGLAGLKTASRPVKTC